MKIRPSRSIRRKLLRSSLAVLAVSLASLLAAMTWIMISLTVRHRDEAVAVIHSDLMDKGRALLADHSLVLPRMVEDNAFHAIADLVSKMVLRDPDLVYGIFMDADRQPWVMADSANPAGRVRGAKVLDDSASLWAAGLAGEDFRRLSGEGFEILEFAAPILIAGEGGGTIRFGLSTARTHEAIAHAARLFRQALLRAIGSVLLVGSLAAALAFLASRRAATRLTRPIRELQEAAKAVAGGDYDLQVDLSGSDEIALLAADFDTMRRRVKEYTERLNEMVEEKVQEIRDILENVGQGLFTVSFDGKVNPDHASTTNAILGVKDVTRCTVQELFRMEESVWGDWMEWLELARLRQGRMSWTQLERLCPVQEIAFEGGSGGIRQVQVGYRPILDRQGKPAKLMVLVQDVTESRRVAALLKAEKEKHEDEVQAILGIVNNAAQAPEFLRDVEAREERLLAICRRPGKIGRKELAEVLRDLHTLKGSAASYGFTALERAARRAELVAAGLRDSADPKDAGLGELLAILEGELRAAIERPKALARRLSGLGDEPSIPIPERKIRALGALAGRFPEGGRIPPERLDQLLSACRSLDHVRLAVAGERYRSMLTRLAARLGKSVEFHVRPESMEIAPGVLAALDQPLVHIFRNAIDHGLEPKGDRVAAGKSAAGRIELNLARSPEGLVLRVEDDGKGIDSAKVAERAVAMGIARAEQVAGMPEPEKVRLILLPGLSTRAQGDDLSGLGVGMDAVASWAFSLGGSVDVSTLPGLGTSIEIRLPPGFESVN